MTDGRATYDSLPDQDLMALCIWREARGEPLEGQRAVGHVIRNRAVAWKQTYRQVILAPKQFSSMTTPGDLQLKLYPKAGDARHLKALEIAAGVMNGSDPDVTLGALYYWNPQTATSKWFKKHIADKMTRTAVIGRHEFFRP